MALVLDETFANGIPASFATLRQQSGTLTATYNSTLQAVDLSNSAAAQSIWDVTSQQLRVAGEMELDLELVADLSGGSNLRHAGAWAVAGQASQSNGFRFSHLRTDWQLNQWAGATTWSGDLAGNSSPQYLSDPFTMVGDRRVLNLRWDMGSKANASNVAIEARVDGVLRLVCASTFPSLRPGIFIYQSTARIHSIKVWDAPQESLADLSFRAFESTQGRRVLMSPEAAATGGPSSRLLTEDIGRRDATVLRARASGGPVVYNLGLPLARRNQYQGGDGRVMGTVKIKGAPDTPAQRRVCLIDETTRLLVCEVFSDPITGAYAFLGVSRDHKYTVASYDHANNYRAVLADNITAEYVA
ncbi:MAG: hypothetical protein GZ093_01095 [Rhodoferax sp.]|uniref:hypothetical protein n=1 Tax=Rhodoferax sp. TaxID=50421 RepID=UPI0014008F3F|nr:hypothetical protein [Rhodoferax sp.]NDP37341.1 hypothetical protein [Rhodoferax sp.]